MSEYLDAADDYRDSVTQFLRDLIALPSPSCEEKAVAERVVAEMKSLGYEEAFIDPMGNAVGRVGEGPTKIVLDAHMDTVGVGNPKAWPHDPFEGKILDGVVFGRGASDNKGALAAQVYAGKLMSERGLDGANVSMYVVGTVMEEDCDGLALGYVLTETITGVDAVVLGECTNLDVYRGHRGRMEMKVVTTGLSSHASAPERGDNAVTHMAPLVLAVDHLNEKLADDAFLGKGTVATTKIECDTASLNAIPDSCAIYLDRRLTAGETRASAVREIEALLPGGATVEVLKYAEPSHTGMVLETDKYYPTWVLDEDHSLMKAGIAAGEAALGRTPSSGRWTFSTNGVSSAGMLGIPTIGFGPSQEKWAHSVLDQCPVDDLVASIAYYTALPRFLEAM
ncbi:MAG TPA: YgeY family selenium metabolism-linked hydrolase [Actinomycetota bacterium]|nr:YgeY family selenium metabolism-linked hydrolase [Actinomycetota bacterium]